MPTDKVTRILLSRGLSSQQIETFAEDEAWRIVYSTATPKKERKIEVCFTGFADIEKNELMQLASDSGLHVTTGITKALAFLCIGENAGPSKLAKAKEQNVIILSREQFHHLLNTGEIPT